MRKDWPARFCEVCGSMITHYTGNGNLLKVKRHAVKRTCLNPTCLSKLKQNNATGDFTPIKPKPCLNCRATISLHWGGCSSVKKTRKYYAESKFCSNTCRGEWIIAHRAPKEIPRQKRPCWAETPPTRNTHMDHFIYGCDTCAPVPGLR